MASSQQELPEQVVHWLRSELLYPPNKMPTAEQLNGACRGNMSDIWRFLTSRVASEARIDTIKRNFVVYGGAQHEASQHEQEQAAKIRQLRQSLKAAKNSRAKVEAEIKQLHGEMAAQDLSMSSLRKQISNVNSRETIENAVALHLTKDVKILSEYKNRVATQHQSNNRLSQVAAAHNSSKALGLESAGERNVRLVTEEIRNELMEAILTGDDKKFGGKVRNLKQKIKDLNLSASELVYFLSNLTEGGGGELKAETQNFDMSQLAAKKREELEQQKGDAPDVMNNVRSLLAEKRMDHIRVFEETEGMRLEEQELLRQADDVIKALNALNEDDHLAALLQLKNDEERAVAALEKIDAPAASFAREHALSLDTLNKELSNLRSKYEDIVQWDKAVEERQRTIREQFGHLYATAALLVHKQQETREGGSKEILVLCEQIKAKIDELFGTVDRELGVYFSLSNPQLAGESQTDRLISDSSRDMGVVHLKKQGEVAFYKSMDAVATDLVTKEWNAHSQEAFFEADATVDPTPPVTESDVQALEEATLELASRVNQWVAEINACRAEVETGNAQCGVVSDMVNEWYTQPAQLVVNRRLVDGRSMAEILKLVKSLHAVLRVPTPQS